MFEGCGCSKGLVVWKRVDCVLVSLVECCGSVKGLAVGMMVVTMFVVLKSNSSASKGVFGQPVCAM